MTDEMDTALLQFVDIDTYPVSEEQQDKEIQNVLDALIELHQLDSENDNQENYNQDYSDIVKTITLNHEMQEKVNLQIRYIDKLLSINEKAMEEVKASCHAENRFGHRLFFHRQYKDDPVYFDANELIEKETVNILNNEEDDIRAEEEYNHDEEEEEEEEEEAEDHVDSEKCLPKKAWSRSERMRLVAGIHSEAKRSIAYDFMKQNQDWRVWEVDKIDDLELENFPVSRLDWDRISSIHVLTRTKTECLMQWTTQEHPIINKRPWSKKESEQLAELVESNGTDGQWEKIAKDLGTNRTISQCFSHYMAEKNNKAARLLKWTPEEDKRLAASVKVFGDCNWQLIAAALKGRTGQQCLHRWTKSINPTIKRTRWSDEESEMLKRAVRLYGAGNWTKIQRLIPGRTDMQCRERWVNVLQPTVRTKMTDEEIEELMGWVEKVGPRWSYIADFFPGRTDNNILRTYTVHLKSLKRKELKEKREAEKAEMKKKKKEEKERKKAAKKETPKKRKRTSKSTLNSVPKKNAKRLKPVNTLYVSESDEFDAEESEEEIETIELNTNRTGSLVPRKKRKEKKQRNKKGDEEYRPVVTPNVLSNIRRSTRLTKLQEKCKSIQQATVAYDD